ncbi:iron-sulfur cluster repair di-iron protein [Paenibacillus curdlanolyticus YK9]|uniref:Iron-sulfur cluster repair di-iron protein n=1 Tax=Paenibacillus curdlanolyticus YK9 TaxID=717606 RepID=E0I5F8_9BACL|nr:iron-sulfur cluster repair di-iron protein [Paenibacillus curdlanolyticus]EFM12200.1 iron-sulfur cluster repair di-iron protein [Paenibacillus curdlanolyticus YK9]
MEIRFDGSNKIGDIVTAFPGASNLFKAHRIDFCCGGNEPLGSVLQLKGIDEPSFLASLQESFASWQQRQHEARDWREAGLSEMIDHIVTKHHAYLQAELPLLSEFVTKVLRVHGHHEEEGDRLVKLHTLFHQMKTELEQHLIVEESVVFPLIQAYEAAPSAEQLAGTLQKVDELESDHSQVGDLLKEMRAVTSDYTLPDGACRTYTVTFQKLVELESDLFEHIHLENNVLFQRLAELSASEKETLSAPLRALMQEHIPLREQMEQFYAIAQQIGATDGIADWTASLFVLKEMVRAFVRELEPHSAKEEDILFPMVARFVGYETGPVAVMEFEHEQAKLHLQQYLEAVSALVLGTTVSATAAADIAADLIEAYHILTGHFMKEETVLFPMAQRLFTPIEMEELAAKFNALSIHSVS